ncbi:hypothetical protein HPB50_011987 [Hyalomma asiaticum]|uniref:Uncharacterized protein n=1 Tax=Hyalomma asiaticum TaxID=266040 RepID=A0ACB7TJ64_HYAAI|nr:hypothetical protein HPB50_011987 [Hyalomma asiaticum]
MIWQRVAKDVHVSLSILLFGLCDAVRHFNDGNRSTADISKEKGIEPGHHTLVACCTRDQYRVKKAQHQSTAYNGTNSLFWSCPTTDPPSPPSQAASTVVTAPPVRPSGSDSTQRQPAPDLAAILYVFEECLDQHLFSVESSIAQRVSSAECRITDLTTHIGSIVACFNPSSSSIVLLPSTLGHRAAKLKSLSFTFGSPPPNFWTPCRPPTVPTTKVSSLLSNFIATKAFTDAVTDLNSQRFVHLTRPPTVHAALALALEADTLSKCHWAQPLAQIPGPPSDHLLLSVQRDCHRSRDCMRRSPSSGNFTADR